MHRRIPADLQAADERAFLSSDGRNDKRSDYENQDTHI